MPSPNWIVQHPGKRNAEPGQQRETAPRETFLEEARMTTSEPCCVRCGRSATDGLVLRTGELLCANCFLATLSPRGGPRGVKGEPAPEGPPLAPERPPQAGPSR